MSHVRICGGGNSSPDYKTNSGGFTLGGIVGTVAGIAIGILLAKGFLGFVGVSFFSILISIGIIAGSSFIGGFIGAVVIPIILALGVLSAIGGFMLMVAGSKDSES